VKRVNVMRWIINWLGLAGAVTTIVLIVVSLFYPWWQFRVGEDLIAANISPLNISFSVLGSAFTMPLLLALNLASILTLLVSSITMIIYSVFPAKSYSKQLLDFSYKKPLYMLLVFVVCLFAAVVLAQVLLHFNVPVAGTVDSTLPLPLGQDTSVSVLISAEFQWPFVLAIASAALCVAARLYHRRIVSNQSQCIMDAAVAPPLPPPPVAPA
jgi:hypothetical protein